jgi:transglutaminase-like putative cysteine protease
MEESIKSCLMPTPIIDSDHKSVQDFASEVIGQTREPIEVAAKLFLAVRDGIRYDPYSPFYLPDHYRASYVLKRGRSFCIPKASLLCALGRACAIPSRVGFSAVRNHLSTRQMIDFFGSDLFVYHGFVEFYLGGRWVKATPAFNKELCERHRVPPLEFNGTEDALFQPYNLENQKFMEYVEYQGIYTDIPVSLIVETWRKTYGEHRINNWIRKLEESGGESFSNFEQEDVVSE